MRFGNYVNLLEVVSHSIVVVQLEREVVLVLKRPGILPRRVSLHCAPLHSFLFDFLPFFTPRLPPKTGPLRIACS